jgi:protein arginine kinase
MRSAPREAESWKRMVLRSMPLPAWLSKDAPYVDVVLSSRARVMRNLRGYRFPHVASHVELQRAMKTVLDAASDSDLHLEVLRHISPAERDYLVGSRLASPDFDAHRHGRALLLDEARSLSVMINEEDHLRVQALTAGWSIESAHVLAQRCVSTLESRIDFAWSPKFGYLSASPFNAGEGRRLSCMLHLIGLAQTKRLPQMLKALTVQGITARGLFGEASRAIGAYVQVSVLSARRSEFVGACEYLMKEEREARNAIGRDELESKANRARDFAITSRTISLADALRVLAWVRWAAFAGIPDFDYEPRTADGILTNLELRGSEGDRASHERAVFLRESLER